LGNYQVLLDSNSQAIKIDKAANDGFFTKNFSSPGAWVSLQNSNRDYGVALYYESHQTQYDGWQKKDVFNNVRADIRFAIPAKATVKARAYLFLGSYKTNQLDIKNLSQKIRAFGVMDSPKENQVITSKTLEIKGWVLDNHPIQKVKVYIDGKLSSESSLQKDRNDICQIYPNYPSCPKVGFQIDLDISKLSDCPHLLELKAIEQGGNEHLFAQEIFMKK